MLPMRVCNLSFPFSFECGSDQLRVQGSFYRCITYFLCCLGLVSRCNNLITPTLLCMLSQITSRLSITGIQVSLNTSRFVLTMFSKTLKSMATSAVHIFNQWGWLEECVIRSFPVFREPSYFCSEFSLSLLNSGESLMKFFFLIVVI
jgi:hypothetical protein